MTTKMIPSKKTIHVVGLGHTVSSREFNACAYTMKVVNFCEMMDSLGHKVYHYGVEGAEVTAFETVDLIPRKRLDEFYGYNTPGWKNKQFTHSIDDDLHVEYNQRTTEEIMKRLRPFDIVVSMFGVAANWALKSLPNDVLVVDAGLGHCRGEAQYKVFESHSIMAQHYGRIKSQHPNTTDTAIQNYFKVDEFDFNLEDRTEVAKQGPSEGYFLVIGRVIHCKGGDVAYACCKLLGANIKFAGQGSLSDIGVPEDDPNVEFIGHVDIKTRNALLSRAKGLIVNSRYLEPFGGVAIEAMLMGVPVIAAARGSFPENIIHGFTGFLVHDIHGMMTALMCCPSLNPETIRKYAVDNFNIRHVGYRYDEYFDRILRNKLWGSNVVPTLGRVLPSNIYGRSIPGIQQVETRQIDDYCYDFGYFGMDKVNVGHGISLIVSPVPPATELVAESCIAIMDKPNFVPRVFDYLHGLLITDEDDKLIRKHEEKDLNIPKSRTEFHTYTTSEFDKWLTNDTEIKRKIKSVHFNLKPEIMSYLIERFSPDEFIIHVGGAEKWDIHRYRLDEKYEGVGIRYFFDPTNVPKKRIAAWTEGKWALGRIYNGIKKYSKICDVDIINWDNVDESNEFWINGHKNYDFITGNAEITNSKWTKDREDIIKRIKPTVHTPIIDHEFYQENLGKYSPMLSAVSKETSENIKGVLPEPKYMFVTQPGVDTSLFKVLKQERKLNNIGYIGAIDAKAISRGADDIKRPVWAVKISEMTGCDLTEITGHDLNVGSEMFEGIDLVISCSKAEGGPLGLFEAASSGVGILSTKVGNIGTLDSLKTYSDTDEAIRIIKDWQNDLESFREYSEKVTEEVREDWSWEKKIGVWDEFLYEYLPQSELDKQAEEAKKLSESQPVGAPGPSAGKAVPITDPKVIAQYKSMMKM